jgi:hypothetical protein
MVMSAANLNLAPDWTSLKREICCPLCDYNLRGLTEPRCPECGHQSSWEELLSELNKHEWLFEHQRKRRARSLLRTFYNSQYPRRFWRAVRPTDEPVVRRLLMYWAILSSLAAMLLVFRPVAPVVHVYYAAYTSRQRAAHWIATHANDPLAKARLATAGSLQAYLDTYLPYPPLVQVWQAPGNFYYKSGAPSEVFTIFLASIVAWPWLTILALQIFRQTLRRSRIKFAHVARCAIYAADVGLLLIIPFMAITQYRGLTSVAAARDLEAFGLLFDPITATLMLACFGVLKYRLWLALRLYLRIPQATATCVACPLIVVLTMVTWYVAG